jgi:hypothetical protein
VGRTIGSKVEVPGERKPVITHDDNDNNKYDDDKDKIVPVLN